jgi:hypothetical protein
MLSSQRKTLSDARQRGLRHPGLRGESSSYSKALRDEC